MLAPYMLKPELGGIVTAEGFVAEDAKGFGGWEALLNPVAVVDVTAVAI